MALKQHKDDKLRYQQQVDNSAAYVLPFIETTKTIGQGINVLEVGCGEGGVLLPFAQRGCFCVGVDLDTPRIDIANDYLQKEIAEGKMEFLVQNIYEDAFLQRFKGFFDVVILKDVIEHIPNQEAFIPYLKNFLKQDGQVFFGFPPWHMPFGGHQQLVKNKFFSLLPYYHLLPRPLYRLLLKTGGEKDDAIRDFMDIRDTGISIERFESIVKNSGFQVLNKQHYLINPIYKYKFGLNPRKQWAAISMLPAVRNFLTTCVYYTVG